MPRQRREAVGSVKLDATFNFVGCAAIEHVKKDDAKTDGLGSARDASQAVHEKVTAVTPPLVAPVYSNQGNVSSRDGAVTWPITAKLLRQVSIMDRMGVQSVESDDRSVLLRKDVDSDIARACEFVGRTFEEVVDLVDST